MYTCSSLIDSIQCCYYYVSRDVTIQLLFLLIIEQDAISWSSWCDNTVFTWRCGIAFAKNLFLFRCPSYFTDMWHLNIFFTFYSNTKYDTASKKMRLHQFSQVHKSQFRKLPTGIWFTMYMYMFQYINLFIYLIHQIQFPFKKKSMIIFVSFYDIKNTGRRSNGLHKFANSLILPKYL